MVTINTPRAPKEEALAAGIADELAMSGLIVEASTMLTSFPLVSMVAEAIAATIAVGDDREVASEAEAVAIINTKAMAINRIRTLTLLKL